MRPSINMITTVVCFFVFLGTFNIQTHAHENNQIADAPIPVGGTAADLELRTFGEYLHAGTALKKPISGPRELMLVAIMANYNITGQYSQVLRLCKFQESIAIDSETLNEARKCRLSALTNLGRYAEAEELAYNDAQWNPSTSDENFLEQINRLRTAIQINLAQGNVSIADATNHKVLALIPKARKKPNYPETVTQDFIESAELLRASVLNDIEQDAFALSARLSYFEQDHNTFVQRIEALLEHAKMQKGNQFGLLAIDNSEALIRIGRLAQVIQMVNQGLGSIEADAGFRDQKKPLTNFDVASFISVVTGDERTNGRHVESRLRLVKAYMVLNRETEAKRLLEATKAIAAHYQLEELASSRLMAKVEVVQADVAVKEGDHAEAIVLLRSARRRLLKADLSERSTSIGRRHTAFDSPLLAVSAKLLTLIAQTESMPIRNQNLMKEILEIAADFSASRADHSAQQASRSIRNPGRDSGPELKKNLLREGVLIDELIDLRGELASQVRGINVDVNNRRTVLYSRMSAILSELRTLKQTLGATDVEQFKLTEPKNPSHVMMGLSNTDAHWQWVIHPDGNTIVTTTNGAIWLSNFDSDISKLRIVAKNLVEAVAKAADDKRTAIPKYPFELSHHLYRALFAPTADKLGPTTQWIISPPPIFDRVPWGALVTNANAIGSSRTQWLIDQVAITITPSFSAWLQLRNRRSSNAQMAFLGIGDPLNSGTISVAAFGNRGAYIASIVPPGPILFQSDSSLARELNLSAQLYPISTRTLIMGKDATKQKIIRANLANYKIILFSTHGYLSGGVLRSLGPSLLLSGTSSNPRDQFLSASEVAQLRLDADLVFLSACDTSASDGYPDTEGFSGLTSAFLLAGARTVVASLWPVETTTTETLTIEALRAYAREPEQPFAFALRKAMMTAAHGADVSHRHPYFWSGFLAVGR